MFNFHFPGSLYDSSEVSERHRHRYEINPMHVPALSAKGLLFVGRFSFYPTLFQIIFILWERSSFGVNKHFTPSLSNLILILKNWGFYYENANAHLISGMGVDESISLGKSAFAEHLKTKSSNALFDMARDSVKAVSWRDLIGMNDWNVQSNLQQKIEDLCRAGGDGVSKPAIRMEMCELKGKKVFENKPIVGNSKMVKLWKLDFN